MAKITIEVGNKTALEMAGLQKNLTELSKIDGKTLDKLVIMSKSQKAKEYLKNNWTMLQSMLSI